MITVSQKAMEDQEKWQLNMPTTEELGMSASDMIGSYIKTGRVMTLSALENLAAKVGQKSPTTNAEQVDRIMEVVKDWTESKQPRRYFGEADTTYRERVRSDLRARLTKLFP